MVSPLWYLLPTERPLRHLMPRIENQEEVEAYIDETLKKNDMDRTELNKGKSGCDLRALTVSIP